MSCISSSPSFSPSSDKRFWSALHSRIDTLLENRKPIPTQPIVHVLQLSSKPNYAFIGVIQGARDLARPPTMTEIYQSAMERAESKQEEENDEGKRGLKRKSEAQTCSEEEFDSQKENEKSPKEEGKLKKAKNVGLPLPDLIVRLQLEALLAEKSRLANENANLTRENQCLHQIVEYHQLTSQDLSESYSEDVIRGLCLDFSSPPPPIPEEEDIDGNEHEDGNQVT
ncbi:hypothetical protein C3L33_23530, partial [Rhododendron williamsianum]